ncbi:MAG: hypothetical protein J3Q66DRAFT_445361 [Benniella sp.]|nr:MAG: hypothetical protein J3Q66DRAFT_445361 [Benniella sp.]
MPQKLPLECLLEILYILSQEYDTDTMARLLCVNKTVCVATLPFLYGDCLNANMHRRSNKGPENSMLQLACTLLRQAHSQDQIPGLLRAAYLSHDHQDDLQLTTESPVFKYGYFLRKLVLYESFEDAVFSTLRGPVMSHAASHQLYEKYVAEGLFSNDENHRDEVLECALKMDLDRQLTWTLCQNHMGTIEELAIPSLDIERYIDHAHHFTSLSRVHFKVPELMWCPSSMHSYDTDEQWNQYFMERNEGRDRLFRAMVRFVQQHTSLHKNVLQRAEVPCRPQFNQHVQTAVDTQFELFSLLPPLRNPRSIDSFNWCQLVTRLSDTNLSYVESIELTSGIKAEHEGKVSKLLSDQPPFLPRCRTLKRLSMETLGSDMFQWAVLERKQRDERHQQGSNVGRHLCSQDHGYHNDLVPLQYIRIINRAPMALVEELNDIAFAFKDSLEKFVVSDWGTNGRPRVIDLAAAPQVNHGCGWNLPCLRTISLVVNHFQLLFDLDALQRSRTLECLCLYDNITTYNHRDIRSWSSVNLPRLKKLELKGSPALRFNLESLHNSPCLEELTLSLPLRRRRDGNCYYYIPSLADLEREDSRSYESFVTPGTVTEGHLSIGRRPRWTWDWELSVLCKLNLEAVFAYKFDFQWLQQLPNLQQIRLDTRSPGTVHARYMVLKDLLRGREHQQRQDKEEDERHISSGRYISSPRLESLELDGVWYFRKKVMKTLCLVVCPNLRRVHLEKDCRGPTLQEWIPLSRKMAQMERLVLNLRSARDRTRELGLIPEDELGDEQRKKKRIEYRFDWGTYYDVLDP